MVDKEINCVIHGRVVAKRYSIDGGEPQEMCHKCAWNLEKITGYPVVEVGEIVPRKLPVPRDIGTPRWLENDLKD